MRTHLNLGTYSRLSVKPEDAAKLTPEEILDDVARLRTTGSGEEVRQQKQERMSSGKMLISD